MGREENSASELVVAAPFATTVCRTKIFGELVDLHIEDMVAVGKAPLSEVSNPPASSPTTIYDTTRSRSPSSCRFVLSTGSARKSSCV
jgi:hypothetical protein